MTYICNIFLKDQMLLVGWLCEFEQSKLIYREVQTLSEGSITPVSDRNTDNQDSLRNKKLARHTSMPVRCHPNLCRSLTSKRQGNVDTGTHHAVLT